MSEQLTKAGPYDLLDVLHRGPRAVTYVAVREQSEQEVVLKMATDPSRGELPADVLAARRLVHRHIVRVLDQGEDNGFPYVVMQRLHGRTLGELIADPGFDLDLPTRVDLVAQVCIGLHHAHEQQVVHGNIRPDNVFVTDDGVAKILNFGTVGGASDRTMVSDNALAGSFEYMSPEQIIGRDTIDGRSDVFSAAIILYELLAGRRPFQGASATATLARVLRDDPATVDVPPRLNAVLRRALEKEPAKRYASAQEFAYALWMMDIPDAHIDEQDVDEHIDAGETMVAESQYDGVDDDAEAAAVDGGGVVLSKPMLVYGGIAAATLIVSAVALVSC